jgi:Tfp pilus assembly protein FimT
MHGRNSVTLIELLLVIGIVADMGSGRMIVAGTFHNEGVETNVGSKCISNVESKP